MGIESEIAFLKQIVEILAREKESPAAKVEALFEMVFGGRVQRSNSKFLTPEVWDAEGLSRALDLVSEVVVQYVGLFADPRAIPVTYYARQKRLAITLDFLFSRILRETVRRSGRDPFLDEAGRPIADRFLDEPILFLKQEARHKHFPKTKKGGGPSLKQLRGRFETKLAAKGLTPGERGYSVPTATREESARAKLLALLANRGISGSGAE